MVDRKFMYAANTASDGAPYIFHFGAYADVKVIAFGRSTEAALDSAIDFIAEKFPGILADDAVRDEYKRIGAEWSAAHPGETPDDDTLAEWEEEARVDTTSNGDGDHCVHSWEWTVDGPLEPREIGAYIKSLRGRAARGSV